MFLLCPLTMLGYMTIENKGFSMHLKFLMALCTILTLDDHVGLKVRLISAQSLSCVWHFAAPWTVACQAPLSMEFSRQEY